MGSQEQKTAVVQGKFWKMIDITNQMTTCFLRDESSLELEYAVPHQRPPPRYFVSDSF